MQYEIFTTPEVFETLAEEWQTLLSHAAVNHIFMTPQFLRAWWDSLGHGVLHIITIRDEQKILRGIAPFFSFQNGQAQQQLQIVGCTTVSDYADLIVDREYISAIYQTIAESLSEISWDICSMISVPHNSPTRTLFRDLLQKRNWSYVEKQQDVCPVIDLPKTWDEYLASIGKKQRHEIKRKWEKLERETQAEFELIQTPEEAKTTIDEFIRLHQHSNQEKKNFWDDQHVKLFHSFAVAAAQQNWLRLFFLKIHSKRVAAMLGFDYDNQFFLYNSGFAAEEYGHLSVGNVLTSYTIKYAIDTGKTKYDFLRGDEEYKFRYRAVAQPIFDITVTKKKALQ